MPSLQTPASILYRSGKPTTFKQASIGDRFELNGNVWVKRSTRTATGIWPAYLPEWNYIRGNELIHVETKL